MIRVPQELPIRNAFTVDVEDYYHVSGFADQVRPADWGGFESRVVHSTRQLLGMLDRHRISATFFILGWVAERHPELIREIDSAGHEIGCHSFWHRLVYDMTPQDFRSDLRRARGVLEDLTGKAVTSYRAPSFSITRSSLWACETLVEEGFDCDSSIYPIRRDRYGIPGTPAVPYAIETAAGRLWEFPGTVCPWLGANIPVSGGGYFRLFPEFVTNACLARINQQLQRPFMFYIHPWELDPGQPRLKGKLLSRFRHYCNLRATAGRLERLLSTFAFGTLGETLAAVRHRADSPLWRAGMGSFSDAGVGALISLQAE